MIKRFQRIKKEFGFVVFLRVLALLIGLIGMSILGVFAFSSFLALAIAAIGFLIGLFAKNIIPDGYDYYPPIITGGLFVYGIILFLGDTFGLENNWKLVIITVTTALVFNLQFWSLSDPRVVKIETSE